MLYLLFILLPACEWEDQTNCKWDAYAQGNGAGHSFVSIFGKVYY